MAGSGTLPCALYQTRAVPRETTENLPIRQSFAEMERRRPRRPTDGHPVVAHSGGTCFPATVAIGGPYLNLAALAASYFMLPWRWAWPIDPRWFPWKGTESTPRKR